MPKIIETAVASIASKSPIAAKNSRFQKGSGCYVCIGCQKKTRSTGNGDNENCRLCEECYEKAGDENAVSDGDMTQEAFDAKWNKAPAAPKARKAAPKPKVDAYREAYGKLSMAERHASDAPMHPDVRDAEIARLVGHGYSETEAANHLESLRVKFHENTVKAAKNEQAKQENDRLLVETEGRLKAEKEARKTERLSQLAATQEPKVKQTTDIANSFGVDLVRCESGKYLFAAFPVTSIFRWMGSQGWTWEDAMKTVKALGIPDGEIAEGTARIQVAAGKKGGDCGGRGPIPELPADQCVALSKAAGKITEAPAKPKSKPRPKKVAAPEVLPVG